MADIVVLDKWRAARKGRPQVRIGEASEQGEIVLFTGVRYERFGDRIDRQPEHQAAAAE